MPPPGTDAPIQHRNIAIAPEPDAGAPTVHRYRTSRPWPVGVLAAGAAAAAVLLSGGLSAAFAPVGTVVAAQAEQAVEESGTGLEPLSPPARPSAAQPTPFPTGRWKIQIGAFQDPAAAQEQHRATALQLPELAELPAAAEPWNRVTRARIGGLADRTEADALCARLIDAGRECFVVPPGN
jgi:cell division septation protein DedD